jgi:predicted ATP-dependent endonuclease of OLD family
MDIKEFRGIECCKTPLSLSNFTVLVGRNNSGKSSILESLLAEQLKQLIKKEVSK